MTDHRNSFPFRGKAGMGVGVGSEAACHPIPILTFPLKGKGIAVGSQCLC